MLLQPAAVEHAEADLSSTLLLRATVPTHSGITPMAANRPPPLLSTSTHANRITTNASPHSSESVELSHSPKTPASPFLHNLHHRFRKGSNASSSVGSDTAAGNQQSDAVDKAEAAQSAKRFLLATIRNDWQWPPLQSQTLPDTVEESQKNAILTAREPLTWVSRLEGQSDIEVDSDGLSISGKRKRRKSSDPYKFENPDAIASAVLEKKLRRKRKVEAEMEWNEGLRMWAERRDAWAGAVQMLPKRPSEEVAVTSSPVDEVDGILTKQTSASTSPKSRSNSKTSRSIEATPQELANGEASNESTWPLPVESDPNAPYVPVYPPLFPTSNTLRSRIQPPAYPTIYSKVVVQSLTPNVPIPLTHMIGAMVDGWKAEGNWPPEAAVAEAAETLKQRQRGKGESAFARWRREQDERRRLKRLSAEPGMNGNVEGLIEDGEMTEKKGIRKHIAGAVRKVFGVGGEEHDADGGLERMGVKFLDGALSDEVEANGVSGLMEEAKRVQRENVALNKGLLDVSTKA